MTKEEVIIEQLFIDRIGKRVYFQVLLPKDTLRIIGLEFGAVEKDGATLDLATFGVAPTAVIVSNKVMGNIMLQVAGKENIFFQQWITEDRNTLLTDWPDVGNCHVRSWTHGKNRWEETVKVDEQTMIEGIYHDSWGVAEYEWLTYKFNVYVWIEKRIV